MGSYLDLIVPGGGIRIAGRIGIEIGFYLDKSTLEQVAPGTGALSPGMPAPWFSARCTSNESYRFDTVAGRLVVLCFFGSAEDAVGRAILEQVQQKRGTFDDTRACFFGVSVDPRDEHSGRVRQSMPAMKREGPLSRVSCVKKMAER